MCSALRGEVKVGRANQSFGAEMRFARHLERATPSPIFPDNSLEFAESWLEVYNLCCRCIPPARNS